MGKNQWPRGERVWREIVEDYYREVLLLARKILEGVALSLGTERGLFQPFYQRPLVRTRLPHYPPRRDTDRPDQYGAAPDTDYGCITLSWQDDVGGLEVRNRSGNWVAAPFIEDTFVVNMVDMLA